jgi:ABC-type multidrug transport system fused ATPase/permease subunit
MNIFKRIWLQLNRKRKVQVILILFLSLLTAIIEYQSVLITYRFLSIMTGTQVQFENPLISPLSFILNKYTASDQFYVTTIAFIITVIFSGALRFILLYFQTKITFLTWADFSTEIYKKILNHPYSRHISSNTSNYISSILNDSNAIVINGIFPGLLVLSSGLILLMILYALIFTSPIGIILSILLICLLYFFIAKLSKNTLKHNSYIIKKNSEEIIKSLQEGLGGIRDIIIDNTQEKFLENFSYKERDLRSAIASNQIISSSPRYVIETFFMVAIGACAYILNSNIEDKSVESIIPLVGILVLGAQRSMPLIQQMYSSMSLIYGSKELIINGLTILEEKIDKSDDDIQSKFISLLFLKEIKIEDIDFRFSPELPLVIKDVKMVITKGQKIGIVGETGSGKSTLLDIIMGLQMATNGKISVDGITIDQKSTKKWQRNISHVPQSIFLADLTVIKNIAFSVDENNIDIERVKLVAKHACIDKTIESWPLNYETVIGERGIKISGGQRQRLGIARALYKNSPILILDEATSALDEITERHVMENINKYYSDVTVLIVTHRISTLKRCDAIFKINQQSSTVETISYLDLTKILI